MTARVKNVLLTLLTLLLLVCLAAAVPSGALTTKAQREYLEQGVDDEYAFLFDD